jgi:predicted glycoside hydrolase/deacetylase ChbG (UPF0249 family)
MITRKAPATATAPGHIEENLLVFEEAPEFMDGHAVSASLENVDLKVKAAQEQLIQLRHQQEEIERQKQHLEKSAGPTVMSNASSTTPRSAWRNSA